MTRQRCVGPPGAHLTKIGARYGVGALVVKDAKGVEWEGGWRTLNSAAVTVFLESCPSPFKKRRI